MIELLFISSSSLLLHLAIKNLQFCKKYRLLIYTTYAALLVCIFHLKCRSECVWPFLCLFGLPVFVFIKLLLNYYISYKTSFLGILVFSIMNVAIYIACISLMCEFHGIQNLLLSIASFCCVISVKLLDHKIKIQTVTFAFIIPLLLFSFLIHITDRNGVIIVCSWWLIVAAILNLSSPINVENI